MSSIKIRLLEEDDFIKLAEFLSERSRVSLPELWKKRFHMWWINNPITNSLIPYGWILENNMSEINGFIGNIPIKFQANGKKYIAVAASSWYVKPGVGGIYSIQLLLAFIKQKNVSLFLNTTPNENSKKILSKIGFSRLDLPFNNTEYWYILNYEKIFESFINRIVKSPRIFSIIKIASFPVKLVSIIAQWFKDKQIFQYKHNDYICSICTSCDESFTELWENNKKENTITLYRDSETLNWLYFSNVVADRRHVIKCNHMQNNKIVGYFVWDILYPQNNDIRIMQLKDIYIPNINEKIILSLISFSINLAKKYDVATLRFWATNQEMDKILKKQIKRRRKYKFEYFYKLNDVNELNIKNLNKYEFIPSPIDPDRGTL